MGYHLFLFPGTLLSRLLAFELLNYQSPATPVYAPRPLPWSSTAQP